jgi:AraC-like DNA-binding protein
MSMAIKDIAETFIFPASCREVFLPMETSEAKPLRERGLQSAGISNLRHPYEIGREDPPFHSINCTLEGSALFETPTQSWHLNKGTVWLVPAHTQCRYLVPKGRHWKILWFHLKDIDRWRDIRLSMPRALVGNLLPALYGAMEGFVAESLSEHGNAGQTAEHYAHIIGAYIDRLMGSQLSSSKQSITEKLEKLILDINRMPDYEWTVSEMSGRVHISKIQFHRWMEEVYGETPMGMVTKLRMKSAREMLLNTDYTVEHIGYSVGYTNRFAFSKAFKRYFGRSPLDFRHRNRNSDIVHTDVTSKA